jgi:cytosol alanyl aminopeptidase
MVPDPSPARAALRLAVAACLAALLAGCVSRGPAATGRASSSPDAPTGPGAEPIPALALPDDVRPLGYALHLEVDPGRAEGIRGRAEIRIALDRPRRVIWLHGQDLEVSSVSVAPEGGAAVAARFAQASAAGVARLDLERPVGPGRAVVSIAWEAPWGEGRGVARFGTAPGVFAATQLEPVDARRAFPCFDEPRWKTPFAVTVDAPAGLTVVSNTPEAGVEAIGTAQRVRFGPTDPLPTYLVFLAVGPLEGVDATVPPSPVRSRPLPGRILVPRGHGGDVAYARDAAIALLLELEAYFGSAFPYPKLDHVGLPAFAVGGMENAGAIAYRADLLVRNRATDDPLATLRTAEVIAHEIAHQWFGDLVTPPGWADLWLNESFAQWMGQRAVHRWRPELGADLEAVEDAEEAFEIDGLGSTRAIRQPLASPDDIDAQFDALTYQKGAAVLAMFERLIGEVPFRDGIRRYLGARRHGTGDTAALLAELSTAAGRDVAAPLATFLDAPGAPRVDARVVCEGDAARVMLRQTRAVPRGSAAPPAGLWQVPVCVRYRSGGREAERCTLLAEPEAALALPGGCPEWIFPNAGAAGYYRFALAPADLAHLRARGLARLSAPERVALAASLRAAQRAGTLPYADLLDVLGALARDPEPAAAAEGMRALAFAHDRLVPEPLRPAVQAWARALYRPALDRLGWEPRPGESPRVRAHRSALIAFLARTGRDPAVRRAASRRGAAWLGVADGRLHPDAVAADLSGVAAAEAIRDRGAPAFEAAVARLGGTRDGTLRTRLLAALAASPDPSLSPRLFALLASDRVDARERFVPLRDGVREDAGIADRVLDAVVADPDAFLRGAGFLAGRLPALASGACREEDAARLEAALRPRLGAHPELGVPLARAAEKIRVCAAERAAERPAATSYFGRRR